MLKVFTNISSKLQKKIWNKLLFYTEIIKANLALNGHVPAII